MQLSASIRSKLYEDLRKFKNGKKLFDLINTTINTIPIILGKRVNGLDNVMTKEILSTTRVLGKNWKIIQLGPIDDSASWFPIRILAQDNKKWKVNPPVFRMGSCKI